MKTINVLSSQLPQQQSQQPVVQPVTPTSLPAHIIQPRHLKGNYFMVKIGLAADRPTTSNEIRFYFATDTFVMSYFDIDTQTWKSGSAFS